MKPIATEELEHLKTTIVSYVNIIRDVHGGPRGDAALEALDLLCRQVVPRLILEIERLNKPATITRQARIVQAVQGSSVAALTLDILGEHGDAPLRTIFATQEEYRAITAVEGWMEKPVRIRIDRE